MTTQRTPQPCASSVRAPEDEAARRMAAQAPPETACSDPERAPHAAFWPPYLPRTLTIPETTLWFNLEVTARRYPRKAAYIFCGQALGFGELHRRAEALAGWLQRAGVQRGERVLLFMQNCPQFVVAFYAIQRADAVVVPVNPMYKAAELGHCIVDAGARVAITSADLAAVVAEADAQLPAAQGLTQIVVARLADALPAELVPEETPAPAVLEWLRTEVRLPPRGVHWTEAVEAGCLPGPCMAQPDDLALLPYTAGTTGLPKGCMHSHRTLMGHVAGNGLWFRATVETVALAVTPMFHMTGLIGSVIGGVYLGSTQVLLPRWDCELAARLIARRRVTHWTCVPTMIVDMLASPNYAQFDLHSLRHLGGGGAAMPQALAERLEREYGIGFVEGYGLTETATATHINPPGRAKLQCLGIPFFGVDSRIIDPDTLRELGPGEVGEIVTHGPMVFMGYWRQPQATEEAFVQIDGKAFFRTGDLGRRDEEGYFFLADRLKRMINASGFKVWPSEVELLLFDCPLVQEACVVGTRDAYRGETVKALVVPRADVRASVSAEQVIDWARAHMAAYKVPRVVEFVDTLPKSAAGKVLWRVLQEREAAASASPTRGAGGPAPGPAGG